MWVFAQTFHVPKHGSAESEYEDAYFPDEAFKRNLSRFRCAVADGATEAAYAREWARLLVRSFARRRMDLKRLQRAWKRLVKPARGGAGPWYLQAKVSKGAFAAFAGLSLREKPRQSPPGGEWRALAVGDSCIFHVRGEKLLAHGPVATSRDFGNSPYLLSTVDASAIGRHEPHVSILSGTWCSRDAFYLATDAMAQWMLALIEDGGSPWKALTELGTNGQATTFDRLVTKLRGCKAIRNDDTTVMRVEVA